MWARYNPSCTQPKIRIKNTGSTTLTSLTITYGLNGATPSVFNWTGSLGFMEIEEIDLGTFTWITGATHFDVTVSSPNGSVDQYSYNNTKSSAYVYPQVMPANFFIEFKTNNYPYENSYTLIDVLGNVIAYRNGGLLNANTNYKDTVSLANGCYILEMSDDGQDGLSWWANTAQGSGDFRLRNISPSSIIKTYQPDFGGKIYQQFVVGLQTSTNEYILTDYPTLNVYPNPSDGHISVDFNLTERNNGVVEINNILGEKVYRQEFKSATAGTLDVNLSQLPGGIYFVTLNSGKNLITKKIVIE